MGVFAVSTVVRSGAAFRLVALPRRLYAKVNGGLLEAALLADGVPADQLYPLDVERALAKLGTIREQILFYETNAQGEQYMSDGQASMGLLPDGRALHARRAGAPIDIQWETSLLHWSGLVVARGVMTRNRAYGGAAVALDGGSAELRDTHFDANGDEETRRGGAIQCAGNGASVILQGGSVSGNRAGYGAGMMVGGQDGTCTMRALRHIS